MSTGTIQGRGTTLSKNFNQAGIRLSMNNGEGSEIKDGSEVTLTGDNEVSLRDTATDVPFGIVEVGGLDGEKVTVHVHAQRTLKVIATGGVFAANDLVKFVGTHDANGVPNYVAAATSDLIVGRVIKGSAQDAVAEIVIMNQYVVSP